VRRVLFRSAHARPRAVAGRVSGFGEQRARADGGAPLEYRPNVTRVPSPGPTRPQDAGMQDSLPPVLVGDADASLRAALDSVLSSQGYRVLTTGAPESAYALL